MAGRPGVRLLVVTSTVKKGDIGQAIAAMAHDTALVAWNKHLSAAAAANCSANPLFFPETPSREAVERVVRELELHEETVGLVIARLEAYAMISRGMDAKKERAVHDRLIRQRVISKRTPDFWGFVSQIVMLYLSRYWAAQPAAKELGPALPTEGEALPIAANAN